MLQLCIDRVDVASGGTRSRCQERPEDEESDEGEEATPTVRLVRVDPAIGPTTISHRRTEEKEPLSLGYATSHFRKERREKHSHWVMHTTGPSGSFMPKFELICNPVNYAAWDGRTRGNLVPAGLLGHRSDGWKPLGSTLFLID